MKKLFILGIALSLFISCAKEDNAGIPLVEKGQMPSQKQLTTLEADKATVADYEVGKKAKIHGKIVREGNFSYFKFSDGTLVQIYAFLNIVNALPQEKKTKLNTAGQEITVTGTFKNHILESSGKVIKEIVYESEKDLVFGQEGSTTPGEITTLEAATATASDYVAEKKVKIHGTIVRDGNHSYFKFSDNTMIQIYVVRSVFDSLPQEKKTKFSTAGQEITVTGKFKNFKPKNSTNVVKEIECTSKDNLVFGAASNNPQPQPQPSGVLEADNATVSDFIVGKEVKLHGSIVRKDNRSYFKFKDDTLIQFYVPDYGKLPKNVRTRLETEGQKITVSGTFSEHNSTRQIAFKKAEDLVFEN